MKTFAGILAIIVGIIIGISACVDYSDNARDAKNSIDKAVQQTLHGAYGFAAENERYYDQSNAKAGTDLMWMAAGAAFGIAGICILGSGKTKDNT